ncbi:MAG: adenylate/guanylate cyclase domain-containing protein [Ardenticatenales bacterium]|nr:adenylate/guanylate cyclase domain-containing protein [Ardenticatenales bacterium]
MSFLRTLFGQRNDPQTAVERLAEYGVAATLRAKLATLIVSAPERDLYRFHPFFLADALGIAHPEIFDLLAPAVMSGLFNLNWEAHCHCGNSQVAWTSLREARHHQTCTACQGSYDASLDDEIAVSFTVNDTVRPLGTAAQDPVHHQRMVSRYGHFKGHDLLTVQVFRNLFVNEPLPTGESFEVRRMAVLFTDLGGSTALYARQGDPRAFSLVREHFDVLLRVINHSGGVVVKTIGDAIMAAFPRSENALRAALESQRAMTAFNRERQLEAEDYLLLKVGIHAGPCLVVTLNERLDYFGTTVNAASRVEGQAAPGEVLFTEEVRQDIQDSSLLQPLRFTQEELRLRGLDERAFTIYRVSHPEPLSSG